MCAFTGWMQSRRMTCHNLWAEELLLDIFSDHTVNADKRSVHTNKPRQARGETFGSIQSWCHAKGHELWLETSSWNMSLKAQLKGQRGCDLFWSTAAKGSCWNKWKTLNPLYYWEKRKRDSVGIKPLEQYKTACCKLGKPRGTRWSPSSTKKKQNRAKEDKEKRQLSKWKEEMLLYKCIKSFWSYCLVTLSLT